MEEYNHYLQSSVKPSSIASEWSCAIAKKIIQVLDDVVLKPAWLSFEQAMEHYQRIIQSAGSGFDKIFSEQKLKEILEKKHRHGVL